MSGRGYSVDNVPGVGPVPKDFREEAVRSVLAEEPLRLLVGDVEGEIELQEGVDEVHPGGVDGD